MRKIFTLVLFCFFSLMSFAQIEYEGSDSFGRIFDLIYDPATPNKIYAISEINHIVVSEDNGESWDILYTLPIGINSPLPPDASIRYLKLMPDGSGLSFAVYQTAGHDGAIMVYDLSSQSIAKNIPLPNQNLQGFVWDYDFYKQDEDVLIVDTNYRDQYGLIYGMTFFTNDGGANWDPIYDTTNNSNVFINKVAISPNNPDKLFLSRGFGDQGIDGGLLVSEDGGQTWEEKLEGVILGPIAFDPINNDNILLGTGMSFGASQENLYKSTNGGNTFSVVNMNWTEGILDEITYIKYNPLNPLEIVLLEENEIVTSVDGGNTWQYNLYLNDNPESYYYGQKVSFNPFEEDEMVITGNYVPLISSDNGQTVSWIKTPYFSSTGNMDVYNDGSNINLYYSAQFGYVHRDVTTGIETAYEILPLNMATNSLGITQIADKTQVDRVFTFNSSFIGSNLYVSNDNGGTRSMLISLFANKLTGLAAYPNEDDTILAAFGGFSGAETLLKKIDFSDMNNVEEVNINLPAYDFINDILISDSGKIVLSIGAEMYSSEDNGSTWENNSSGLENLILNYDLIYDIDNNPLNVDEWAIATTKGIFMSTDGGEHWEQKTTSVTHKINFSTEVNGHMAASTHTSTSSLSSDFQLYYSINSGGTWETITNQQLLHTLGKSSAFIFDGNSLKAYIGSFDLGLMTYTIDLESLSIPDVSNSQNLKVFPNPTNDILNIKLKDGTISNISLFDIGGREVLSADRLNKLSMKHLSPGMYVLRIRTKNKNEVYIKKIILE
ncbi:hypothetical protein D778_02578 [Xanthomarina gelatinilytica]|uniref:Secretion system C-terminal sorting domain-containing protein n=1 Tax=Xanthomarina gelatinilytica TaxID=1137281 RepID=M7N162_9FLAO|nr:T9SS type A sorting domain-containing protein [Xanthomarina gelatinilytica]EMQ95484.1 hypothetical protein D778_02578 [Xanthomarina gelatinilytica]